MRKVEKGTTSFIRLEGRAEKNGVAFKSKKFEGPVGIGMPEIFARVTLNGEIYCSQVYSEKTISSTDERISEISNVMFKKLLAAGIFCIVCAFLWGLNSKIFIMNIFFNLAFVIGACMLLNKGVAIFCARFFEDEEMENFSKFLGAKNAVQNAFYDLGRVPTIQEVKTYPIFILDNKYLENANSATFMIAISFIRFFPGVWYCIVTILTMIVIMILDFKNKLFFWQFLIVSKPDDIHYQTALKALEESVEWIDCVKIDYIELNPEAIKFTNCKDEEDFSEDRCNGCFMYSFCKEIEDE